MTLTKYQSLPVVRRHPNKALHLTYATLRAASASEQALASRVGSRHARSLVTCS